MDEVLNYVAFFFFNKYLFWREKCPQISLSLFYNSYSIPF